MQEAIFLMFGFPSLAPSRALLKWSKGSKLDDKKWWATFVRRYRSEMAKTDARQTIQMLAMLARQTPISVGCRCSGSRCHRFELVKLIRSAHAGKL